MEDYKFDWERAREQANENGFILGARGIGKRHYIKTCILPDLFKQAGCTAQDFSDEDIELLCRCVHIYSADECIRLIAQLVKAKKAREEQ